MANYTPTFTKPYPNGWVDKPSKTTPATAEIMNSYDTAIAALEAYLRDNAIDTVSVSVEQFPSDGRQWLGTITVGSNQYRIYMPSLKYENSVSNGTKIGTITLGEQSFDVYAPTSSTGGSTVSVVPKTLTGTNIAEITVDGTTYQLYAPTGGSGSGSTVTAEATLTEGTQIGKITIDGVETILYAPTASPITVDAELSATSENAVQNKVVTAELNKKIETLDDDSQAPDAVNFDLDSELSLASVKGVQNKAIAEEFQKYADGTKPVAKATEATTAESATKAAQDAQGNVIDTTYAKKTEVPAGTIVDSELSATSENAVQNKVVTAELNKKIETLDDDSQAPDAVNFDLDSELSLASVKGVQNKAIAEEFQKYADGTKPVAKATEATTAESATKAAQDAQGNVIDTTYAKKTEVPAGTIVDSELSAKSENPVQNKVVKAEFDKVDSNFTDLEMLGWSVPKECPIQNEVNENQFVQKVGRVDLGSLYWVSVDTNTSLYTTSIKDIKTLSNNVFLLGYSVTSYNIETSKMTNKNIKMSGLDKQDFYIKNDSYTNSDSFKQAMQGQYLYYELATPITKTIDGNEKTEQIDDSLSVLGKCKNLLNPTLQTTTKNGITCTNNGDGTYTLNGTATEWGFFNLNYKSLSTKSIPVGIYKVVGADEDISLEVIASSKLLGGDNGNGYIFEIKTTDTNSWLRLTFSSGKTFNNVIVKPMITENVNATYVDFVPYTGDGDTLTADVATLNSDLSDVKDGTTAVAKAVADEDGNNIKSTYAKKTETSETVTEDVNVVLNSDLFDSTYSYITCVRIGKLCVLSFTIRVKNTIFSTIDKIVLMSIVGEKYQPKKITASGRRQIFQGFAVGNYDENGKQSQSLNNTVRIITDWDSNYTEIITRDKDRLNWSGYVQGQIMWVTD